MRKAHAEAKERLITGKTGLGPDDELGLHSEKHVFQDEPAVVSKRWNIAPDDPPFHPFQPGYCPGTRKTLGTLVVKTSLRFSVVASGSQTRNFPPSAIRYPPIRHAIDTLTSSDYSGHMIASLRESKANLSKLVARAAGGEEVLITVRGRPTARLVAVGKTDEMAGWSDDLKVLQAKYTQESGPDHCVVDDLREERY